MIEVCVFIKESNKEVIYLGKMGPFIKSRIDVQRSADLSCLFPHSPLRHQIDMAYVYPWTSSFSTHLKKCWNNCTNTTTGRTIWQYATENKLIAPMPLE